MRSIKVNDVEIFQISNTDEKLLEHDFQYHLDEIDKQLKWIIEEKCNACFKRMKLEWVDSGKLTSLGISSIPTNRDDLVNLITTRPEYKNRIQREAEKVV